MELSTLMDAWGILTSGSTIANGDAWEHLQAQCGGGTGTYFILADGLEVEMFENSVEVVVDQSSVDVVIDQIEILVEIDQAPLEVEI